MLVLGIETSCDETGVAIVAADKGLIAHQLYSQIELHQEYGGVVPELASRDHIRKTIPMIKSVLRDAKCQLKDLDGIAYTAGPGLAGALLVGATIGRSLGWSLNIPVVGVHHMEAHLMAPMLEAEPPPFPFLALLVSGGHTLLVDVREFGQYRVLGQSLDDAAGEAFDKTAKILGLGYPGGPAIEKCAQAGDRKKFRFPRPMTDRPGLDFSFSGLKTFALNTYRNNESAENIKADIACAFEEAVVDTLVIKSKRALEDTGLNRLVIAGGVGANTRLREALHAKTDAEIFYPRTEFCTDNGAMVAYVGCARLQLGQHDELPITIRPRWSLDEL